MKYRIVIFGTSPFGCPSFAAIAADPLCDVILAVTQPARPVGRHQQPVSSPVATWAAARNIRVLGPATLKTVAVHEQLAKFRPDVFLVASYGLILPTAVLDLPARGALNIHASLLPRYRGASPVAAAIANGDTQTGVTFMVMDAGCDTGPIIAQFPLAIHPDDTRPALEQRLAELAAEQVGRILNQWCTGHLQARPQPDVGQSNAPRLSRQSGRAGWDEAASLERKIRAYQPWPGVWTEWQNREIKILAAVATDEPPSTSPPGTVVPYRRSWAVVCTQGMLVPTVVQFAGRRPQPAGTIPGSYPGFIGAVLD